MERWPEVPKRHKGKVTIAKGFQLWREVDARLDGYHGMDITATVTWSNERRQLEVSRLEVRQMDGGEPITSEALRRVAVQAIVRHSIVASVRDGLTPEGRQDTTDRIAYGVITREQAAACKAAGPVPETLKWVATIYRLGVAIGEGPTKCVREVFDVSQSTAGAWVAAARRQGHLDAAEGPGKAGG